MPEMSLRIDQIGLVTPAGCNREEIGAKLGQGLSFEDAWLCRLADQFIAEAKADYPAHDRVHHLAVTAARQLKNASPDTFVNVGSSRGATERLEKAILRFQLEGTVPVLTSPMTTLGQVAGVVAKELKVEGGAMDHSMTCSTSLQAVANAASHIQSGQSTSAVVGGTEAPITPFTIAQFKSLRLINQKRVEPTIPFGNGKGLVLGEGAGLVSLTKDTGKWEILGIGQQMAQGEHMVDLAAESLRGSMTKAWERAGKPKIDFVMAHAPGTKKGDETEKQVIQELFGNTPMLSNKWAFGHTFGASGILNLIWAAWLLDGWKPIIPVPYHISHPKVENPKTALVNAVGFGGNAVSVVLRVVE